MEQPAPPPMVGTPVGSAAAYYTSTSPVPIAGATVLTASGPVPSPGGPPSHVGASHGPATGGRPYQPQQQQQQQQRPPTFDPPPLVHMSPQLVQQAPITASPAPIASATVTSQGLKRSRTTAESALREYMALQRRRRRTEETTDIDVRLKLQAEILSGELSGLRSQVAALAKAAEQHRWRRWLIGGIVGTFIPAVRAVFRRRPSESREGASNSTEYAFFRSKSLIGRIMDSVHGLGGLASITFFVFSVLYVFQNEVSLRVAKTVGKRLRRLSAKVQGAHELDERDVALLAGWRWRILEL